MKTGSTAKRVLRKPAVERERVGDRVTISRNLQKSPNWYISYSESKKLIRYSLETRSKKRARELAKKKDAELVLGVVQIIGRRPVSIPEVAEKYVRSLKLRRVSPGTLESYRRDLDQFAAYARWKKVVRLDQVSAELLEDYQERLQTFGMEGIARQKKRGRRLIPNGPKTVRNKLKTVRQLLKWAIKRKLLREDPGSGYQLPPEPEEKAYCWSPSELLSIRANADEPWPERFDFFEMTGLRSSEFGWLLKEDVYFGEHPYLMIRAKTCPQTGIKWRPKHGRHRIVPLCPLAAAIAKRAYDSSPGPWLFWSATTRSKQVGHLTSTVILAALRKARHKAGVGRGTVHTFRHVFCSFAANNGVPALKVMAILGHGSLDIVLSYYHVTQDELLGTLDGLPFESLQNGTWQERRAI